MEKYELVYKYLKLIKVIFETYKNYKSMTHIYQKPMKNYIMKKIIYSTITLNNKSPWFKPMAKLSY